MLYDKDEKVNKHITFSALGLFLPPPKVNSLIRILLRDKSSSQK